MCCIWTDLLEKPFFSRLGRCIAPWLSWNSSVQPTEANHRTGAVAQLLSSSASQVKVVFVWCKCRLAWQWATLIPSRETRRSRGWRCRWLTLQRARKPSRSASGVDSTNLRKWWHRTDRHAQQGRAHWCGLDWLGSLHTNQLTIVHCVWTAIVQCFTRVVPTAMTLP